MLTINVEVEALLVTQNSEDQDKLVEETLETIRKPPLLTLRTYRQKGSTLYLIYGWAGNSQQVIEKKLGGKFIGDKEAQEFIDNCDYY